MFLRGKSECILRFHAKFSPPNNKQNFWKFKHTCISREIRLRPRYYFRAKREFVSFPCVAIVLDPISEIFEQKEIRFPYNSLQFCRLRFSLHDFTVRKKRVFYEFPSSLSLFFFEKKREVNILTIPLQKKRKKKGEEDR